MVGRAGMLRKENGHSIDDTKKNGSGNDNGNDNGGNGNGSGNGGSPSGISEEGLRDWFGKSKSKDGKRGWVNVVTGGSCASDKPGEGTPKCVSSSKRASMTKTERKSAARRKKAADPGQQSKTGAAKPTYVSTDKPKKVKEDIELTDAYGEPFAVIQDIIKSKPMKTNAPDIESYETYDIEAMTEMHKHAEMEGGHIDEGIADDPRFGVVGQAARLGQKMFGNASQRNSAVSYERSVNDLTKSRGGGNVAQGADGKAITAAQIAAQTKKRRLADPKYKPGQGVDSGAKPVSGGKPKPPTVLADRKPAAPAAPVRDRMANSSKEDRMAAFAKANPKLAARQAERDRTRGTSATTNPLMKDMKSRMPAPAPKPAATGGVTVREAKDKKGKGSGNKDACYHKVKSRYSVWPSAYASGALVKCRKVGAANWGNKTKKEEFEFSPSQVMALEAAGLIQLNEKGQKCWKGYEKKGTKKMFGKTYNNCVKKEEFVAEEESDRRKDERQERGGVDGNTDYKRPAKNNTNKFGTGKTAMQKEMEKKHGKKSAMEIVTAEIRAKHKKKEDKKENTNEERIRINQNGHTYAVMLNWRGKTYSIQIFFPELRKPTRQEVEDKIRKIYPDAKVTYFAPKEFDPADPTVMVGEMTENLLDRIKSTGRDMAVKTGQTTGERIGKDRFGPIGGMIGKRRGGKVGGKVYDQATSGNVGGAIKTASDALRNSYEPEGDLVDEANIGYSNPSIDGSPIQYPKGHPKSGKSVSFNKAETEGMDRYRRASKKAGRKIYADEPLPEETKIVDEGAAWTKKSGKNSEGGLNEKGRKSYERENPGSDLKAPSKKVGNKRRASFCARMKGMKRKLTSKKTANDPDSRINKSLRKWNC